MSAGAPLRSDAKRLMATNREDRSPQRLQAHYKLEHALAARLRTAKRNEREHLYRDLYTELFALLPDHPQHKVCPQKRQENTAKHVALLRQFVGPTSVYLEVGCGDAAVTQALAPFVQQAIGVDVTPMLVDHSATPTNFRFIETNGTDFAVADGSVDLVYSNQLMEHFHPDDAAYHLQEIFRVLRPGGAYLCTTPNRITGPHDISGYFGHRPTGFHLREYDHASLAAMFRTARFRSVVAHVTVRGQHMRVPLPIAVAAEKTMLCFPRSMRTRVAAIGAVRNVAGLTLIGRK